MSANPVISTAPSPPIQAIEPIRNLADLWKAVITCQTQQLDDTDAMYQVYQAMSPKLTFQDLANTFSGVYADTYWNVTFMDESVLAKSMVQTLGLSPDLANQYATQAMLQWRGIFSRKNFGDYGSIPVPNDYTESPDIICNEDAELNLQQVIQQWNNEFWKQPSVGKNYVYVRCQNMSFQGGITTPVVSMFYTAGGFNQPPTSWIQCYTVPSPDSPSTKTGSISSLTGGNLAVVSKENPLNLGDRAASQAFFFTPTNSDHVCVIATIATEFFANNPLNISGSNWNSNQWITCNGAAAWHNVDPQRELEDTLKFYNQDNTQEKFYFSALCRNVPIGTRISFSNNDPAAAFDTGVVTVSASSQEIKQKVTLPANYEGTLRVRLESPDGTKLAGGAAVKITMFWRIQPGHTHYAKAAQHLKALAAYADEDELTLDLGSFTIIGSEE